MLTRSQQGQVREWLQIMAAGENTVDAGFAVQALEWIAELARAVPASRGPMVQIRARGPVSISEIKDEEKE